MTQTVPSLPANSISIAVRCAGSGMHETLRYVLAPFGLKPRLAVPARPARSSSDCSLGSKPEESSNSLDAPPLSYAVQIEHEPGMCRCGLFRAFKPQARFACSQGNCCEATLASTHSSASKEFGPSAILDRPFLPSSNHDNARLDPNPTAPSRGICTKSSRRRRTPARGNQRP